MSGDVYLVDGARTPFLKARQGPGPFTPVDLAVQCGRPLLMRQPFGLEAVDLVILGCVNVVPEEMNPARVAALRLGLSESTVAFTVQINCGSGMKSIDLARRYIRDGSHDLILAGGAEALSHSPVVFAKEAVEWYAQLSKTGSVMDTAKHLAALKPHFLQPAPALKKGLTDPISNLSMGQTAEILAYRFDVSRESADAYAKQSHLRLGLAQREGWLTDEVMAAFDSNGNIYTDDDGVRTETELKKMPSLAPVFESPYGQVTAGNSSQVTDGASWVIIASEEAVKRYNLSPIARLVDSEWAALDPSIMGLGPVLASTEIIKRGDFRVDDIDAWEINEAFATQVLACLAAWKDESFCKNVLGLDDALGEINRDRLNIDGGAISLGHPVGTSGNRIVLHLANVMRRHGYRRGIATECIGGGQGGAMLMEAV